MTATFIEVRDVPDTDRHPKALVTGVVLSLALHLGLAAWLTLAPWAGPEKPPPEFIVDVVQLPPPVKPKPPEPPAPAPTPPVGLPPPPVPQLTEAPIAEKSAPPPHDSPVKAPPRERAGTSRNQGRSLVARTETSLQATTKAPEAEPIARGEHDATPGAAGGKATEVASQTVQDFILMQISRVWVIDVHSPRFRNLEILWPFILRPDGTLAPPWGKDDPWDLQRMVDPEAYAIMQERSERGEIYRTAITTFLQAVRQAQPFRVPSNEKSYKDRILPLHFRAGDLEQSPAQAGR